MKRIYFTTVIRKPRQKGKVGNTYAVDWDTKNPLWEKKSGSVRGMSFVENRLLIATGENEVKQINPETGDCISTWTYPELRKLHKIYYRENEGLILTSCGNDSRAVINVKNMKLIDKVSMSGGARDTLHFNSIGWDGKGQEYHVYHKPGTVVNAKTKEVVFSGLIGSHDIEFIDDHRAIINDSSTRRALIGDTKTKELRKVFEASDGRCKIYSFHEMFFSAWYFLKSSIKGRPDSSITWG